MTVSELLERISSAELTEWRALFIIQDKERKQEEKELENNPKSRPKRGKRR